jgi:two-component system, OmpR family, alkaline phosphatase synthesis response regulator PhoP
MAQRILVADDDPQILRLVKSYLEREAYSVITAEDGETALHLMRAERPDLAVLDVMMPRRDGLSLLRLMRADAQLAGLPVLMLTARVENEDRLKGLDDGADDYLTKPFNPPEVAARVRAILRRANGQLRPSAALSIRGLVLDSELHTVARDGTPLELTPTEFDLLKVMMQQPNHPFTRGELIERALGFEYDGFDRTIDSHIKNLRRKVEPDPGAPIYIETVFGVGYRISK